MSSTKKTAAIVIAGILIIGAYASLKPDENSKEKSDLNAASAQISQEMSVQRTNVNNSLERGTDNSGRRTTSSQTIKTFEETIGKQLPDASQWGLSRTRFRNENGNGYKDIVVDGYNCLKKNTMVEIGDYTMEAYYQFATDKGSYYGLSKVAYILDVSEKKSAAELEECYSTLVQIMSKKQKPTKEASYSVLWELSDYTIEIAADAFSSFNGSTNKAIAVFITEAFSNNPPVVPTNMRVNISATNTYNYSVGNQWTHEYFINGNRVYSGSQIKLSAGDTITVTVNTTENDKSPDYGYDQVRYIVTQDDINKGFKLTLEVVVREDKGRYSGNTAGWTYRFTFSK